MNQAFSLFHLNLTYSSITVEQRDLVIQRCYEPLLDLVNDGKFQIGIELNAWTLKTISDINPDWVQRFKSLLSSGKCELIGSGYVQLIGPLVPHDVNIFNQKYGMEEYERLLNVRPELALVNETAYSSGMVGVYKQVGYKGIILDRDNIALALGQQSVGSAMSCYADSGNGEELPVLWSDSFLFQKFQRYAHGDIRLKDYLEYFKVRSNNTTTPLSIYCNDAEIFDHRPGRFDEESPLANESEWHRIKRLYQTLSDDLKVKWLSPSRALELQCQTDNKTPQQLTSAQHPIPVKKQAKYNISRWAISGRNDLWINTICHRIYQALKNKALNDDSHKWRSLCECWASDLRTHITAERWDKACQKIGTLAKDAGASTNINNKLPDINANITDVSEIQKAGFSIEYDPEEILLSIRSKKLQLVLNLRRGLAIDSLAFLQHDLVPVIGTLPHGYFQSIELGADFYSAGTVVELTKEHSRITDLERVHPKLFLDNDNLRIRVEISTELGPIEKEVCISKNKEKVGLSVAFPGWQRPYGTVRVNTLTLLPKAFTSLLNVKMTNGGTSPEMIHLKDDCEHQIPASSLVSASAGLGGESGELEIGDKGRGIRVNWKPSQCAAFPMLSHKESPPAALTRLFFSLSEVDETFKPGGILPAFELSIQPS